MSGARAAAAAAAANAALPDVAPPPTHAPLGAHVYGGVGCRIGGEPGSGTQQCCSAQPPQHRHGALRCLSEKVVDCRIRSQSNEAVNCGFWPESRDQFML